MIEEEEKTSDRSEAKGHNLDLTSVVQDALHNMDFVRESGLNLQISAEDGTVTVSGVALSRLMKRAILQAVIRVPGVHQVIDSVYTDTDLASAVSQALSIDPVIKHLYEIRVTSYRGQVTLIGEIEDAALIKTATGLASVVPGVREVVNRLILVENTLLDK